MRSIDITFMKEIEGMHLERKTKNPRVVAIRFRITSHDSSVGELRGSPLNLVPMAISVVVDSSHSSCKSACISFDIRFKVIISELCKPKTLKIF